MDRWKERERERKVGINLSRDKLEPGEKFEEGVSHPAKFANNDRERFRHTWQACNARMWHRVCIIPAIRRKRHGIRWHDLVQRPRESETVASATRLRALLQLRKTRENKATQWPSVDYIKFRGSLFVLVTYLWYYGFVGFLIDHFFHFGRTELPSFLYFILFFFFRLFLFFFSFLNSEINFRRASKNSLLASVYIDISSRAINFPLWICSFF